MKRKDAIEAAVGAVGLLGAILGALGHAWGWWLVYVAAGGLLAWYLGTLLLCGLILLITHRSPRGSTPGR